MEFEYVRNFGYRVVPVSNPDRLNTVVHILEIEKGEREGTNLDRLITAWMVRIADRYRLITAWMVRIADRYCHVVLTRHPKTSWSTEYQPQIYGVIIQCFCGGSGSSSITGENNLIPAIPLQWLLFETVHVLMLVENVKYTKTVLDLGLVHP